MFVGIAARSRQVMAEQRGKAGPGPAALFVIAAGHEPDRAVQEWSSGREEIGIPGGPAITPRRTCTSAVRRWARRLAIEVVTEMDHQVRVCPRGPFSDRMERPL